MLRDTSLASSPSWADQVKKQPAYRSIDKWHYLNIPDSLTFNPIEQAIGSNDNKLCNALLKKRI
ncbi:hypothetical protein INP83_11490 [Mucilaginibacter sp. 21P]|nr:hypothetical protein INP83_11490 [Mucilaginibacter sp. 21P]